MHLLLVPQETDHLPNERTCSSRRDKKTKHLQCTLVITGCTGQGIQERDELRQELSSLQEYVKGNGQIPDISDLQCFKS